MAHTVLVVEDEAAIADTIAYALKTDGLAPVHCTTGEAARAVLADRQVDLVILDVGLPDVNGFDLCRELRRTSDVPVIFLTARAEEVDRVVGLEIGADDYVVKPFSPRELTARVKAVLRRMHPDAGTPEDASAAPDASGAFSIDERRRIISYQGEALELSRYEFRILEILIRRPGWVYSREQLMDLAWEEPEMSLSRTVDTHIKTIRGKLRAITPDVDPIRTHRGIGYSLREDL